MATRLKSAAPGELERLSGLVAEQHRRLRVVRREVEPHAPAAVVLEPMPARCAKPRLTAAALTRLIDEAAPPPEPRWAAYLITTLELTMRRWGVRQIVAL
jgi:hypothetical protein